MPYDDVRKTLSKVTVDALGLNPALLLEKSTSEKIPMEELLLKTNQILTEIK